VASGGVFEVKGYYRLAVRLQGLVGRQQKQERLEGQGQARRDWGLAGQAFGPVYGPGGRR
jgi:hypothetical protein